MSSPTRNLSKNTGRYVENTNKKNSFLLWQICQFNHYGWLILLKFYWFLISNSQNLLLALFLIRAILDPKFPLMTCVVFHVPSVYWTTFHVPLRYIERYFTYSIVYRKAPCVWLCIRQHYYLFEIPRTLSISRDPTRIPYPPENIPLAILLGSIHRKQHLGRLLRTYPQGISWVAPFWQSWWETWLSELFLSF